MKFEEMRVKDVHCVVRYTPKQDSWRAKNRTDHIVGIMLGGCSEHDFGYKSFALEGGRVFFFNMRDDYSVRVLERGESLSIHFTTYEPIDDDSFCISAGNSGELVRILEKTETTSRKYGLSDCATVSLLYKFCGELVRLCQKPYYQRNERLSAVREYIDTNFCRDDCIAKCAHLAGVTSRRFNDIFKSEFNMTPNRYIIHRRIEYAGELLRTGSFSVSEVAEICGFCDVYYFSRVFKAENGVPPREWR